MSSAKEVDDVKKDVGEGSSSSAAQAVAVTKSEGADSPAERRSTLPPVLQFPLVAILSFSISSLGYSFINEFAPGELATVMRTLETPRELGIMTAWRLTELALGWFANFDSVDLAALNLLSHSPTVSLPALRSLVMSRNLRLTVAVVLPHDCILQCEPKDGGCGPHR
jgi:hypothetical protein